MYVYLSFRFESHNVVLRTGKIRQTHSASKMSGLSRVSPICIRNSFHYSDLRRLPGDKRYCQKFRHFPYDRDVWFLDVVDIAVFDFLMSHMDSKHTYISEGKNFSEPEFNVMFDFGHA